MKIAAIALIALTAACSEPVYDTPVLAEEGDVVFTKMGTRGIITEIYYDQGGFCDNRLRSTECHYRIIWMGTSDESVYSHHKLTLLLKQIE